MSKLGQKFRIKNQGKPWSLGSHLFGGGLSHESCRHGQGFQERVQPEERQSLRTETRKLSIF